MGTWRWKSRDVEILNVHRRGRQRERLKTSGSPISARRWWFKWKRLTSAISRHQRQNWSALTGSVELIKTLLKRPRQLFVHLRMAGKTWNIEKRTFQKVFLFHRWIVRNWYWWTLSVNPESRIYNTNLSWICQMLYMYNRDWKANVELNDSKGHINPQTVESRSLHTASLELIKNWHLIG